MIKQFLSGPKTLLSYKDLIWQIAIKELAVKYRYPFLGIFWAFLMPLSLIITLIIVFSRIIKVSIPEYPFPVYLISGILPWNYVAASLSSVSTRISDDRSLVKSVYFPREIIPIASVLSNLITFLISLCVMFVIFVFFNLRYNTLLFFLPFVIFVETLLITGISLIVSSLQVKYRDIRYIVEVLLLIIFYLTPIFYPVDLVRGISNNFFKLYLANPFVGIIILYRVVFLNGYIATLNMSNTEFFISALLYPVIFSILIFVAGFLIFKKLEPAFTDYL